MQWARGPQSRQQLVLFPERLEEAIPQGHSVRLLQQILERVDWRPWEAQYKLTQGMPPIHPRVMAGVLLYGLLKRIRTSRGLEEALHFRLDFRWLAEGRSIDHTTLSKFRQSNTQPLSDLFVQVGLIAQQMGYLTLVTLGYDGTRMRASNRRSGTRSPEELRQAKKQLAEQFEAHRQACEQAQGAEDQAFEPAGPAEPPKLEQELRRQAAQIDAALAELARIEAEGKKLPDRLPITDPHARLSKSKEGSFAVNYNPTITVDVDSGLIVDADVIRGTDEQNHMIQAVERARANFAPGEQLQRPVEVLADGLMATGSNISECPGRGIEFFSPAGAENPAYREDPSVPLSPEQIDRLPLRGKRPARAQSDTRTFDKSAFLYDRANDVYWCPMGKRLPRCSERTDHRGQGRLLYRAAKQDCAACPLRGKCFRDNRNQYGRRIECGEHEVAMQAHAAKMHTPAARSKYARRAAATERPFALIKEHLGARGFLTRGIERVANEWRWLVIACNLHRLLHLEGLRGGSP